MNSPRTVVAIALLSLLLTPALAEPPENRFSLELELGSVWQASNDVQIPNDENGTRFSMKDLVGAGPWVAPRLEFYWNISRRHGVRVVLAPLSYSEPGVFDEAVDFAGETFEAGVPTEGSYKFNSWRVSYRYRFHDGPKWRWWVGFTAKIRDARIALEQPGIAAEDTNVGFVPLLYLHGDWNFAERWHFQFKMDALAGGPGRAEDVALKIAYDFGDRWQMTAGYRVVEGGADVDEVYNFAWFNYAVVSGVYRF